MRVQHEFLSNAHISRRHFKYHQTADAMCLAFNYARTMTIGQRQKFCVCVCVCVIRARHFRYIRCVNEFFLVVGIISFNLWNLCLVFCSLFALIRIKYFWVWARARVECSTMRRRTRICYFLSSLLRL